MEDEEDKSSIPFLKSLYAIQIVLRPSPAIGSITLLITVSWFSKLNGCGSPLQSKI